MRHEPRPSRGLAAVALAVALAGCGDVAVPPADVGARSSAPSEPAPTNEIEPSREESTGETTGGGTDERTPPPAVDRAPDVCGPGVFERIGTVERADLIEASGLVASRRHPGVLWAHNDSGQDPAVFAVGPTGDDLGSFELSESGRPATVTDVEDIAIGEDPATGRSVLYLADIGDNQRRRDSVSVLVVAEPEPGADGTAEVLERITFGYPDGPTDAEAVVVDPEAAELFVLSKDLDEPLAPTRLYTVPLATDAEGLGDEIVVATAVGAVDMASIGARSARISIGGLLFPGAVTGADLSPAGDLLVLRTYGSAWLFARRPGQPLVEALAGEPCEGGSAAETQGEAIAFVPTDEADDDGVVRYATIGEGRHPAVNLVTARPADANGED